MIRNVSIPRTIHYEHCWVVKKLFFLGFSRKVIAIVTVTIAVFVSGPQYETLPNRQLLQGLS